MSEPREIQQIEYRWQPGTDMTAIASSMSSDSRRLWTQRLGSSVRHPDVDGPTESVRYEVFGNGTRATLAWRQRDPRPALVTDGPQTRPIVSRVLVGSGPLLPPGAAIVLCATGLPEVIGPPLGGVSPGAQLPAISAAELGRLNGAEADRFDTAAAEEEGLELVIAAALGNLDTPLSVELPERFIAGPVPGSPQALLLWGLYATLSTLLGPRFGRRTWSFSTFEPPLGDTDPEALGAIVFRATQAAQKSTAPLAFRPEILVRPYEAAPRAAETREQELAQLLVASYKARGGRALRQLLDEWTRDCQTSEHRIDTVYRMLAAPPRDGLLGNGMGGGAAEQTMPGAPATSEYASDGATVPRQAFGDAERTEVPVPRPTGQPQAELTGEGRAEQEGTGEYVQQPATLSELVGYLSGGTRFDFALRAMRAERFNTDPDDRAFARKQLRDHGWYVDILERNRTQHVDDILVMVFMHTVLPDLTQPGSARELTGWAAATSTPARVIKALYAAGEGTAQEPELAQILAPALGGRWLAERGISAPPVQVPSARVQTAGHPGRAPGRHSSGPRGESRQMRDKAPESNGAGPSAAAKRGQGFPGAAGSGAAPANAAPPAADPAPSDPVPLLSMATVIGFLRRRIPVYAALLIAIGLMVVVLIA